MGELQIELTKLIGSKGLSFGCFGWGIKVHEKKIYDTIPKEKLDDKNL